MMTLDQFVAAHEGVTTDVDGAYGGQCWDLWSAYAQECYGVSQAATSTTSGYADSVYTAKYDATDELQAKFGKIAATATAQAGDVAFWAYGSSSYPQSHVAIVLQDTGGSLLCLSQNPGPPQRLTLTKTGLCGYLRPLSTATATQNGVNRMQCIIQPNDEERLVYFDGTKIHNLTNPDQVTALQMVAQKTLGHDLPVFKMGSSSAPWATRLQQAVA